MKQLLCKVLGMLSATWLKGNVYLAVRTDLCDIRIYTVSCMDVLEHLRVIKQSTILVINNSLETEIGLLPDDG